MVFPHGAFPRRFQMDGDFYSAQAASEIGFSQQIQMVYRGIGYVATHAASNGGGTTAVVNSQYLLPQGTPGLVVVNVGVNDATQKVDLVTLKDHSKVLWSKPRHKSLTSQIVINGVRSRSDVAHGQRPPIDKALQ